MKITNALTILCFAPLVLAAAASAQEQAPATPEPTPVVEVFGCNFNGSNDMADLQAATARWNTWADRNNVTNYTAFLMTPYLHSDQLTYDVLWLGAWPNGTAMGEEEAKWFATGGEVEQGFAAVIDCSLHAQYAEFVIGAPEGPPPEAPIGAFSDCKIQDGRTVDEALAALVEWREYLVENGVNEFNAVFFPVAGGSPDADYDFKTVEGYETIQSYGRALDVITRGGYQRADELFSRLLDCDSPRVYIFDRVRLAADE
jgi:hypothetical protein